MAKYSFEFKKQIVHEYLSGKGGYKYLSNKYGIPPGKDLKKWVNAYNEFGDEGLMRFRKNETY